MRMLVAMSGGVDSSVAAALMLERGHDVVGVTLKQWEGPGGTLPTAGCCTVADAEDARRVSAQLGIPYYVLDYTEEFREAVVGPFGDAYRRGLTPNPCVECNRRVRFRALLDRAGDLGCDGLVTGHHARVVERGGTFHLLAGRDGAKDQSYVLHMLGQAELARVVLPIGEMTKAEVRTRATALGLRTAAKPDSQDICFVGTGNYREFLREHAPETIEPGPVIDVAGTRLGEHDGIAGFTIGQRRGLGIAAGEPRYVVEIDAPQRTVVVGARRDLAVTGCQVGDVTFTSGAPPAEPEVQVKVRYRSRPVDARIIPVDEADGQWRVEFDTPHDGAAPGQAAVFYRGAEVLGGGTILSTILLHPMQPAAQPPGTMGDRRAR